jgi:hypothetical protein
MHLIFLANPWIFPSPPAGDIGEEEINLEKHIRIKLVLVKKEKKQYHVDDPDRPAQRFSLCRKDDRDHPGNGAEKFEVTHRIACYREKYLI